VPAASIVQIDSLSKRYAGAERPAVDDVSLEIARGRIFGLLGPNGAGKTTLMSVLCGLMSPSAGSVRFDGRDVEREGEAVRRRIGLVPQDLAVYPALTARENLAYFGGIQGLAGATLARRIDFCLEAAGLEALADRRVETFSGGLKRRLNLVIALIHEPELLVLDEPTVGIDPQSRNFIHEKLVALNSAGMTIIYTSHYMEEVEQLCDELAIIDHGRIIARGTIDEILNRLPNSVIRLRVSEALPPPVRERLHALAGLKTMQIDGHAITLESERPPQTLDDALALLRAHGLSVTSVSLGAVNLEQVFLALTGTRLRDGN
jgi:linearmycin/streptolysin S transport system ATP-binding protein